MVIVRLKGVHTVSKRLANGKRAVYHYAWRGGPRIHATPGSPDFIRQYQDAYADRSAPEPNTLLALITDFKASAEFAGLAASTRREYAIHLDSIADEFGSAALRLFEDKRMRGHIRKWRDAMAATPRRADYAIATLRRLLSFGVDNGELRLNIARGFKRLHTSDRSEIIWLPGEIEAFCRAASPELQRAFHFARLSGLRREDLLSVPWSADKGTHIEWKTSKSRSRRTVLIPVTGELRRLLDAMPRGDAVTIIANTHGQPWTPDGFSTVFQRAKLAAKVDKRLHDLRGNAATALCLAGLDDREVAEVVGWSEQQVARIRRLYVSRETIIQAAVHRLERNKKASEL